MIWEETFKEIKKLAFPIGTALIGGLTAWDVKGRIKENSELANLEPPGSPEQNEELKLSRPNAYQFEGGKHTELKPTTNPHLSMYR